MEPVTDTKNPNGLLVIAKYNLFFKYLYRTHKLIRKDSIRRAKRKIVKLSGPERERFICSWKGHIQWANTYNLKTSLRGG